MQAAACASGAALGATLVRSGSLEAGAGIGLAAPAVAVARNGGAVITAVYSGPGKMPDGRSDAYPGVGVAFLDVTARGGVPLAPLARSAAAIVPRPAAGGGPAAWGELGAADVHPVNGAVYVAARRGGGGGRVARAGNVGSWVGVLPVAP